eukprot:scaffold268710_cov21-Tisochrysis_lutea.AAC.1
MCKTSWWGHTVIIRSVHQCGALSLVDVGIASLPNEFFFSFLPRKRIHKNKGTWHAPRLGSPLGSHESHSIVCSYQSRRLK